MENIWYILKGEEKQGPYSYGDMIGFVQSNQLLEYNYVWAPHLDSWTMVYELPEFSKDRYLNLLQNNKELAQSFMKRSSPRLHKQLPIFVHNNMSLYEGHTVDLSYYGSLIHVNTPLLLPKEQILIHFAAEKNVCFNVTAEIIRKMFSPKKINVNTGLQYAVRYLQVPEGALKYFKTTIQTGGN